MARHRACRCLQFLDKRIDILLVRFGRCGHKIIDRPVEMTGELDQGIAPDGLPAGLDLSHVAARHPNIDGNLHLRLATLLAQVAHLGAEHRIAPEFRHGHHNGALCTGRGSHRHHDHIYKGGCLWHPMAVTLEMLIELAGGASKLAQIAGVDRATVRVSWRRAGQVPVAHVRAISDALDIPPHLIRPDVWAKGEHVA